MEPISIRKVVGVALVIILFMLALFVAWYYVFVVPIQQAAAIKQAQADEINRELRAKYCTSDSYVSENIRRFCTSKK
ncbi:MAG: hypothetical protein NUV53_00430 [Patescibacteria group bacterium]|nr:hypothetical protein [Patescibacteria group bacterium]